jgi:hypothetical protein
MTPRALVTLRPEGVATVCRLNRGLFMMLRTHIARTNQRSLSALSTLFQHSSQSPISISALYFPSPIRYLILSGFGTGFPQRSPGGRLQISWTHIYVT